MKYLLPVLQFINYRLFKYTKNIEWICTHIFGTINYRLFKSKINFYDPVGKCDVSGSDNSANNHRIVNFNINYRLLRPVQ